MRDYLGKKIRGLAVECVSAGYLAHAKRVDLNPD